MNKSEREREALRSAAALLGSRKSARKAGTSRENGKLGGKARVYQPCPGRASHLWVAGICKRCGKTQDELRIAQLVGGK